MTMGESTIADGISEKLLQSHITWTKGAFVRVVAVEVLLGLEDIEDPISCNSYLII